MTETIGIVLMILPFLGVWATYKLWKWWHFYGTRFLGGLVIASAAADLAAWPIAVIASRRVFLGPDAPRLEYTTELLGFSLAILEAVFIFLVLRWGDLDKEMERTEAGEVEEE
jgi:hypothetical protein